MAPRKHRKQMTAAEIQAVDAAVKSVKSWVSKSHYETRSRERSITRLEAYRAIAFGSCIEAKADGRVVMRHASGVCVVVEIPTRSIVTVWYNDPSDNHSTLDLSAYCWVTNLLTFGRQFAPTI